MAPPIPTTTPIMVFLLEELSPELPELPLLPLRLGVPVEVDLLLVVTGTRPLLVMTWAIVLLSLTVMIVVTTA